MTTETRYGVLTGSFRTPGGRDAVMRFRDGTNDWNTLTACMTEDEYRLRGRSFSGHALDIGGYLGGVGIALALDNPDLHVTIVEPVPPNADLIRENIALNDLGERVTLIESAAGGSDPVSVWYGYRGNASAEHHAFVGNSTLAYDHGGELAHEEVTYDTPWTLADLLMGEPKAALVKIDCEGGEWTILDSPLVDRCEVIVGEAHSVRGKRGDDIVTLLAGTHDVTLSGNPQDIANGGTCGFEAVRR